MFEVILLTILLVIIFGIGIFLLKKIPKDKIVARATYIIAWIGILVTIIISLISASNNYIKEKQSTTIQDTSSISDSEKTADDYKDEVPSSSESEPNDDFSTATLISGNNIIYGSFSDNDDIDCYYFSTTEKISFTLKLFHEFNDSDYDFCTISIYNSGDFENPILEETSSEKSTEFTTSLLRVPKGSYYIKISPHSYNKSPIKEYNFSISVSNEDSSFESEPNNSINEAKSNNSIPLNNEVTGNIQTDTDVDYYYLTVTNSGKLSISFSHNKMDNDRELWNIELLSESQDEAVTTFTVKGNETNKNSDTINISPQKNSEIYYLKVYPNYNYSSDDYKICINFSSFADTSIKSNGSYSYDKEPNNQIENSTPISLNTNIEGNIQSESDVDYYRFSVGNDGTFNIQFVHDFNDSERTSWKISLLSEKSTENLLEFEIAGNESDKKSDNIRIPPGIYYLKIEPTYNYRNDSYIFKLNFEEV